jgi:hypothetical protein
MVRDRGQRRMRRIEKRRKHTHRCSGAHLDGIAGQCLRGRPEAARGWLHRALTGSTTPRRFHRRVLVQLKHQRLLSKHRTWRNTKPEAIGGGRFQGGTPSRSPRRGGGRQFHLVELVGGAGASDSPKVATAMVAGVGRNGQAMAAAIQITRGVDGRQGGERVGLGWVGLTNPDPNQVGLAEPGWAGWASRPVEPAGQMGQIGFGQLI